jgi:hypothetical protein
MVQKYHTHSENSIKNSFSTKIFFVLLLKNDVAPAQAGVHKSIKNIVDDMELCFYT